MNKKVLKCPFCFSLDVEIKDKVLPDNKQYQTYCECLFCGARGPISQSEKDVADRYQNAINLYFDMDILKK